MSFLEFQDQMYMNAIEEKSCLIITSSGIGLEQLMVRLCRTYSDETGLVLVIGTNSEDETYITNQLVDEKDIPYGKLPQRITAESSDAKNRKEIYRKGGVLFVTDRILIVDLLMNRVPIDLITGIIVYKAHNVFIKPNLHFILVLYRQKNKTGFIKALSQKPRAFLGEFAKLNKIMSSLFVKSLQLWPRFHAEVQASLAKPRAQPEVIEINLPLSPAMKNIQLDIIDLIDMCLKELAKTNTSNLLDSDQLNVENAIDKPFDDFLKRKLDGVWHMLSPSAKRYIKDIQSLRELLLLLTRSDVVTFYQRTRAAQNSVRLGNEVSDWIFWKPADRLFQLSKERVYPKKSNLEDFDAETNLKWRAFQDLIDEICTETSHICDTVHVFIIVANDSTAHLLKSILVHGATNVLREKVEKFNALMKANTVSADAFNLLGVEMDKDEDANGEGASSSNMEPPVKKRFRKKNPAAQVKIPENYFTLTQIVRKMNSNKEGEVVTLDDENDGDNNESSSTNVTLEEKHNQPDKKRHKLELHYFVSARDMRVLFETQLKEHKPMHIIMYDLDMHTIRQIEIYQALHCHPKSCKVYTVQFENSCEMQQYLTSLRREKEAFESLIKERASMVVPNYQDGCAEGHPALERDTLKANQTTDSNNTRRAGGQVSRADNIESRVLVDMREFRCELPLILHKRGIELRPIQLEIGDYILSSDICVERKSISDLIQSLQSGRLYNQATMMTRHFKNSILLIEFDENKSFHFKGRYQSGPGGVTGPKKDGAQDLMEKLILLTIHHPSLRLVWSPSPHFSGQAFESIKRDSDQPDEDKIAAISSEELPAESFEDRYDVKIKNFLLKLPGVNSRNVYSLMNAVPTLADLVKLSLEELQEILHNSRSAELLYQTLNSSLRSIASDAISAERLNKKSRLFSCTKRRKGLL